MVIGADIVEFNLAMFGRLRFLGLPSGEAAIEGRSGRQMRWSKLRSNETFEMQHTGPGARGLRNPENSLRAKQEGGEEQENEEDEEEEKEELVIVIVVVVLLAVVGCVSKST